MLHIVVIGHYCKACIPHIRGHYIDALDKAGKARQYVMDTYDVSVTARRYMEEYKR